MQSSGNSNNLNIPTGNTGSDLDSILAKLDKIEQSLKNIKQIGLNVGAAGIIGGASVAGASTSAGSPLQSGAAVGVLSPTNTDATSTAIFSAGLAGRGGERGVHDAVFRRRWHFRGAVVTASVEARFSAGWASTLSRRPRAAISAIKRASTSPAARTRWARREQWENVAGGLLFGGLAVATGRRRAGCGRGGHHRFAFDRFGGGVHCRANRRSADGQPGHPPVHRFVLWKRCAGQSNYYTASRPITNGFINNGRIASRFENIKNLRRRAQQSLARHWH